MFSLAYDFGVLPNCLYLELLGINIHPSTDLEEAHQFFPVGAGVKMLPDTRVFLCPTMLCCFVEEGIAGFPHIGFSTTWTGVLVDH